MRLRKRETKPVFAAESYGLLAIKLHLCLPG